MPSVSWIDLLGMRVSSVTRAQALDVLLGFIRDGTPHMVVTADASGHVIASRDPEFLSIVNRADLVTPDSSGILWAARLLGHPLPERVSGVELAEELCARSARCDFSLFFYGAAPGVASAAALRMVERYPDCRIAGTAHGYLESAEERAELLAEIVRTRPDVLLVALGIPAQEKWIARHLDELGVPVCMGVGGAFDVFSGRVDRAPVWMQRRGLEWLYRLYRNPAKWTKAACLPVFVMRVLLRRRLAA